MKIWSIKFTGIWPVGSAAIVCTSDHDTESEAVEWFREEWRVRYPSSNPEPVTASLLDGAPGRVHILVDGNY